VNGDALLWGVVLALVSSEPKWREHLQHMARSRLVRVILPLSLVVLCAYEPHGWKTNLVLLSVKTVVIPLTLLSTMFEANRIFGRILESGPFRWVGRLSYSLYLWQQLFLAWDDVGYGTMDVFNASIGELLDRFELREKENALVATLSKGMKQKLAVACAFVHNAELFLCDEPFIGIDPQGQHRLKEDFRRLRDEGKSILVSTHLLDTAERLCDRVIIMKQGKVVTEGTLAGLQEQSVLAGKSLEDVFLRLTGDGKP